MNSKTCHTTWLAGLLLLLIALEAQAEQLSKDSYETSIAVLPFVNISGDPGQEYLSIGITQELISALSKLKELKVIQQESAFSLSGRGVDLHTTGEQLNVDNVLEGFMSRSGNQLRISVRLIKLPDKTPLWSESYDGEMKDIFEIQDKILRSIVNKLSIQPVDKRNTTMVKSATNNLDAYDLYLRGLHSRRLSGNKRAIDYFRRSLALDPDNACAYAELSFIYGSTYGALFSPEVSASQGKAAAAKALAIDDTVAEAHLAMGALKVHDDYDWIGAERSYRRAIELAPSNSYAHMYYAYYLFGMGNSEDAVTTAKHALELDPLSPYMNHNMATILSLAQHWDQAIEHYQKTIEMYPHMLGLVNELGNCYAQKGMYEQGITVIQRWLHFFPEEPGSLSRLGEVYALAGNKDKAREILDTVLEKAEQGQLHYYRALLFLFEQTGEVDKAIEWLERAYEDRMPGLGLVIRSPSWSENLRSDPRYIALVERFNFPD
jgi:TolB-like protein/Flp pilus assembly protein TadD